MLLSAVVHLLLAVTTAAPIDKNENAIAKRKNHPYYGPFFNFCGLPGTACYTRIHKGKEPSVDTEAAANEDSPQQDIPFAPATLETFSFGPTTVTGGPPITSTDAVKIEATATAAEDCTTTDAASTTLTFHTGEALPPGGGLP